MARPPRLQIAGGTYHVVSRGNAKQTVFHDRRDFESFLAGLGAVRTRLGWEVLTYCLMPNHVHLLIRTPEPNLSRGMQQVLSRFALVSNRRRESVGHVFQGRFRSEIVQRESHLLEAYRYIALNPVRARLTDRPDSWPWGAHRALARARVRDDIVCADALEIFGSGREGRAAYRRFVADAKDLPAGLLDADEALVIDEPVDVAPAPAKPPTDPAVLLAPLTPDALVLAHRAHGVPLSAIGEQLGVHRSTVLRRIRAIEAATQRATA